MAALTISAEAIRPNAVEWRSSEVKVRRFNGAGTDDSTIEAAAADKRHVIVAGRCSFDGAERMDILSGANVIDSIEAPARCTAEMPKGLECDTNEALILNKAGAAVTVRGWIAYVTLEAGSPCRMLA